MDFPIEHYSVEDEKLLKSIRRWEGRRILLKLPAALLRHSAEISKYVEGMTAKEVVVSSRPSFGACDVSPADLNGFSGVLDLGHTPMPSLYPAFKGRYLSVPLRRVVDEEGIETILRRIPLKPPLSVGLLTTAQHRTLIQLAKNVLEGEGFKVFIGKGGKRLFFPGQVLGCDLSAARAVKDLVDLFLYIGTGEFHPRGVMLSTGKRVLVLDPVGVRWGEVDANERERFIRRRYSTLLKARELLDSGEPVGIYISYLIGQSRRRLAEELKEMLEERGIDVILITSEVLTPGQVRDLSLKVIVNTACPRITFDDSSAYSEVGCILLSPWELEAVLFGYPPINYVLDEFE
ncbi:MAG: diphthamide biosynthesis enzyme Dph2 [Thermoplasmata archaeon]|nr:diphthamide biosynthesis enzyme Dph2 [Thermoplasmata archaeon]